MLVRGEVIKRGEVLRVNISGTFGMFIESSKNASETLTEGWTIEGEEHPYQPRMEPKLFSCHTCTNTCNFAIIKNHVTTQVPPPRHLQSSETWLRRLPLESEGE